MKDIKKGDYLLAERGCPPYLTEGKTYEVIQNYGDSCLIIEDAGGIIEIFNEDLETVRFKHLKGYPKVMEVSAYESFPSDRTFKRVVFTQKNGWYLAWNYAKTLEDAEEETACSGWKYARDIEEDKEEHIQQIDTSNVNRVEVIDDKGRSYVNWKDSNNVELSQQDDGKTLKIFIKSR